MERDNSNSRIRSMLRPSDNKCRKWVVMVAVYVGVVLISTSFYMGGVLYVAILDKYNEGKAITSFVIALNSGLLTLLGPLSSLVIDRFSSRVCMVTGGIILTVSGLLSAFVSNTNGLIVTYGIIGGIGNSLVGVPCSVILAFYFNKRRNLVIALSTTVVGLGMFIASPIALYIVDNFSLEETFLIIGALNCQICVIGMICKPSESEKSIQRKNKVSKIEHGSTNIVIKNRRIAHCCNFGILTNKPFLLFLLSTMAWSAVLGICFVHLPYYATMLGSNDIQIALLMTCFSISNTSGRFLFALTVAKSRLNILVLYIACLVGLGIVNITYPLYSVYHIAKFIFAVFVGVFTGASNALTTPITLQMTGVENVSAAHGLEYLFSGAGALAGPPIAGVLFEKFGSYRYSFIFSGFVSFFGTIFAIMALCKGRRQDQTLTHNRGHRNKYINRERLGERTQTVRI